jgi:hypothetical protein
VSPSTADVLGAPTNSPHAVRPPSPNRGVSGVSVFDDFRLHVLKVSCFEQTKVLDIVFDGPKRSLPFPTQHSTATHFSEGIPTDSASNPSFSNVQSGSRLLQLGTRKIQPQANRQSPSSTMGNFHADTDARQSGALWSSSGPEDYPKESSSENVTEQRGFIPFDPSDTSNQQADIMSRVQNSERSVFEPVAMQPDLSQAYGAGGHLSNKGSRFAKFFDGKGRIDTQQTGSQAPSSAGFPSPSPMSGRNQEPGNFNSIPSGNADNRAMSDIFAMLHNASQVRCLNRLLARCANADNCISQGSGSDNEPYGCI